MLLVLGAAYVGHMDDLAVFDRSLTDAEVKHLHGLEQGARTAVGQFRLNYVSTHPAQSYRYFSILAFPPATLMARPVMGACPGYMRASS